ncbi:MAG TPA: DUF1800 domain-containing protein [Phnomibacter sp.]|nr:DUF1800 domain-containing protein [Phnomibacter sp.]
MRQQNHFYWRAGFGPTPEMLFQKASFKAGTYFDAFWKASEKLPIPINVSGNVFDGLNNGLMTAGKIQGGEAEQKAQRQQMQKQSRESIRNLNLRWLDEMVNSPAQLREKAALFWHGHFASRNLNSFYQQQLLTIIRDGALGNFADLLRSVSKSAAMLAFLNNQQNRKQQPNENFAREVMELFTLGRGNYSETDIKEAARAFTGWGFNLQGEFVFRKQLHDTGSKTIFGKTGNFDGDDVLNLLLERRETATWIARKMYRFYVNDTPNEQHVSWLANRFYEGDYNIKKLLQDILTSSWFYDEKNMGAIVKSPIVLWTGIRRILPMELANPEIQMVLQRALGQVLLYPPSVAGWPGGTNWIDSSSLLLRMRLPQLVAKAEPFELATPLDDDLNMGMMQKSMGAGLSNRFALNGDIGWEALTKAFENSDGSKLEKIVPMQLLQTAQMPLQTIAEQIPAGLPRQDRIIKAALLTMATPEYQLC